MKEVIIFLFLFLVVFISTLFVFNGRFIYAQMQYFFIGPPEIDSGKEISVKSDKEEETYRTPERLIIPVLGIDVPIVLAENNSESAFQSALEKGVVLWPGSALLGETGNMIILGHSSAYPWYRGEYGSVFSLLDRLKGGDEIFVASLKEKYTYKVVGREINLPENLSIESPEQGSVLYLLSCWPVRTDWKRIAVKATPIDIN